MATEEIGERVPEIAGGAHPVDPQRSPRSVEWPRRSPMAAGRVHSTSEPPAPIFARVTAGSARC